MPSRNVLGNRRKDWKGIFVISRMLKMTKCTQLKIGTKLKNLRTKNQKKEEPLWDYPHVCFINKMFPKKNHKYWPLNINCIFRSTGNISITKKRVKMPSEKLISFFILSLYSCALHHIFWRKYGFFRIIRAKWGPKNWKYPC